MFCNFIFHQLPATMDVVGCKSDGIQYGVLHPRNYVKMMLFVDKVSLVLFIT